MAGATKQRPPQKPASLPTTSTTVGAQKRSFREVVSSSWAKEIDVSFAASSQSKLSTFKGEPALLLTDDEEQQLALPFQFMLVGKFSRGRPSMASIRQVISAAEFQGHCDVGLLDFSHVFFKFQQESDFHRMWLKQEWSFNGFNAKIFRWTTDFDPEREPSIVPVWIKFPLLPMHLFSKEKLFSLGSAVGKPLKMNLATAAAHRILRPSEARLCVELDILKQIPSRVWIGNKEHGRWQQIEAEDMPEYCTECNKIGHTNSKCKLDQNPPPLPSVKVWIPKNPNSTQSGKGKLAAGDSSGSGPMEVGNTTGEGSLQADGQIPKAQTLDTSPIIVFSTTNGEEQEPQTNESARHSQPHGEGEQLTRLAENQTMGEKDGFQANSSAEERRESTDPSVMTGGNHVGEETSSQSAPQQQDKGSKDVSENASPMTQELPACSNPPIEAMSPQEGVLSIVLPQLPKVLSTSDLHHLRQTTESELDPQEDGNSYEEEGDTDEEPFIEVLPKRSHKTKKTKQITTKESSCSPIDLSNSARRLRSHKIRNAFGYESR